MPYMNWKTLLVLFTVFFFSAPTAYAGVLINEVAWMGVAISGGDTNEWIELYNSDATPIDLSGWSILADDGSPAITLSGTISANGFFLIERTDDTTVPEITADLITPFGKGLENTGETLLLKDASGVAIDTVIGGTDWANIGGDNTTKQTAQRTANSWVTGAPTPRAQNVAQGGEVLGASIEANTTGTTPATPIATTASVSGGMSKPSMYPRTSIMVEAGSDIRAFASFPVSFLGSSTGLYNEPIAGATYRWNFGDGAVGEGQSVNHVYDFAGEYVVTLEVFWSKHHEQDRLSVVVVAPEVKIAEVVSGMAGFVRLANQSEREINISGWTLRESSGASFVFPPNSIILSKKIFTLSNKQSSLTGPMSSLLLQFPDGRETAVWGVIASSHLSTPSTQVVGAVAGAHDVRPTPKPSSVTPSLGGVPSSASSSVAATVLWEKAGQRPSDFGVFSENGPIGERWLFAIFATGLILVAGYVIFRSRGGEPTIDDEYAIIEDIIESKETIS
jgi:hypothetical protein